jgi:putative endonuclease
VSHRSIGRQEEDRAARFLMDNGYTIVTRRYTGRHGELDLVALDGDLLVFVEVKSRTSDLARPEEAVGDRKRKALYLVGQQYLFDVGEPEREVRYDLIAISPSGIRHYEDFMSE